jgi:hypothetical protein
VLITPNRLTVGRPHGIIDPSHVIELDRDRLRLLCAELSSAVEVTGVHGAVR